MALGGWSDLLSSITENVGTGAGNYLTSQSGLSALIRYGSDLGLSGRGVLSAYREAGGTVTNSTFWQLRSRVLAYGQPVENAAGLLRGDESLIDNIPGGRAGRYQIDFRVYVTRPGGGRLPTASTEIFSMMQRDLDVDSALSAMQDIASQMTDKGGEYGNWTSFEIVSIGRYTG